MTDPLAQMIDKNVKCVLCGTPRMKGCDCWVQCSVCGWHFEKGSKCRKCADPNATPGVMFASGNFND